MIPELILVILSITSTLALMLKSRQETKAKEREQRLKMDNMRLQGEQRSQESDDSLRLQLVEMLNMAITGMGATISNGLKEVAEAQAQTHTKLMEAMNHRSNEALIMMTGATKDRKDWQRFIGESLDDLPSRAAAAMSSEITERLNAIRGSVEGLLMGLQEQLDNKLNQQHDAVLSTLRAQLQSARFECGQVEDQLRLLRESIDRLAPSGSEPPKTGEFDAPREANEALAKTAPAEAIGNESDQEINN